MHLNGGGKTEISIGWDEDRKPFLLLDSKAWRDGTLEVEPSSRQCAREDGMRVWSEKAGSGHRT